MKINKNIFSIPLFALSFILLLFSCNQPSGTGTPGSGNPEETQKEYPETISSGFEKLSPDPMDFSSLTGYIAAIKNLLQPEEALTPEGYREFLSSLQEGLAKIIPQDQEFPYTLLTNEYAGKTPSDIEEKQTSTGYNTEEYNSLYKAFEESLTALNTAYTSYETAYNDYKSAYEGTSQTGSLDSVKELLKKVIKDFNDDFYFEKETLESTELSPTIEECIKEQTELKTKLQSYWDNESSFIYSQEKFQQALSALRAYTPETFENVIITYGETNINDFLLEIGDKTKTITFNVPETEIAVIDFYNNYIELKTKVDALENKPTLNVNFKNLGNTKFTTNEDKFFDLGSLKSLETLIFGENNFNYKDKPYEITDLPYFEVDISDDNMTTNLELYNTGIDTIIKKYFDVGNVGNRLNVTKLMGFKAGHHFDATPFLNGGQMYDKNEYNTDSAYKLDINAALLMGASLKNVEITGTNKTSKNTIDEVTNVRVSSDVSAIEFKDGSGIIDFVNNAPIDTPDASKGKVIIRSVGDNDTFLKYAASLDLSLLDSQQINKLNTNLKQREIKLKDMDSYNVYSVKNFTHDPGVVYVNNQVQFGDNSKGFNATNADWEQAGNEGTLPPQNTANVSQANVKSVKSLVMKRLLDDNQRVYG